MRRRLWNTCLVSPTFCKVFLLHFSSVYSARALIGIKHLISAQFQPLALFSHKSITLAPSQEANKTEKTPNPNRLKNSVPQEIVGNGQVQAEALGNNVSTCWGFCSGAERSAGANRISLWDGAHPASLPGAAASPQPGKAQEQGQSSCQVGTGTVLQLTPSQAPRAGSGVLTWNCAHSSEEIKATII